MEELNQLVLSYRHSKESYDEQERTVYVLERKLEELKKEDRPYMDSSLRLSLLADELSVYQKLVEQRRNELREIGEEVLEAMKELDIPVDTDREVYLEGSSYLVIRRSENDELVLLGPFTQL